MQPTDKLTSAESESDVTALPTGYTLGRYRFVSILGQGSFGTTYQAYDTQLDCDVAIKEFFPSHLAARQGGTQVIPRSTKVADDFVWGRGKFLEEGKTLASLRQAPAIVRILDFLEANGTAYIIMEMLKGETLEAYLKRSGRLSYDAITRILNPLLDGLEQVHVSGFLHRDIKPANILIDRDGNPTLIDFGASRLAMVGRTQALTAVFTPGYAASEQFTSARQGPWTDIYSVSATLYQAITGSAPPSAIERMLDDDYVPLTKHAPAGFPPNVLIGLDAGLAVRASDRPQNVAGWRLILSIHGTATSTATVVMPKVALASASRLPSDSSNISKASRSVPKSKSLWLGAVAVAFLATIGVGYFVFGPSSKVGSPEAATALSPDEAVRRAREALVLAEKAATRASEEAKQRGEEEQQRRAAAEVAAQRAADEAKKRVVEEQQRRAEAEAAATKAAEEVKQKVIQEQRQKSDAQALAKQQDDDARRKAEEDLRRRDEAEAVEKRLIGDELRRTKEALAAAETSRRQAEQEASRLRVEAETAAKRQAEEKKRLEEDVKQKAEVELAARRAADEAAANKRVDDKKRIDEEAKRKAEAEAAKKQQGDDDKKAAEAVELALRLGQPDRQKIQLALTALGFDTLGMDGMFGPRSREMITAWQRARNYPTMGYFTSVQLQSLLREAALPIAKYEGDQRKIEEEKKKVDAALDKAKEEAKVRPVASTAATSAPAPVAAAAPAISAASVTYSGTMYCRSQFVQNDFTRQVTAIVINGQGAGQTLEKFYMRINEQNAVAEWFGVTSSTAQREQNGCGISFKGKVHETGFHFSSTSTTCSNSYRCELSMKRVP